MKVVYKTVDGKVFDNKEDALNYEEKTIEEIRKIIPADFRSLRMASWIYMYLDCINKIVRGTKNENQNQ